MFASLAIPLLLIGLGDGRSDEAERLLKLIQAKSTMPKTLAFVYEGRMRWVADRKLTKSPEQFEEDFQGTFLYRSGDGAALYDLYDHVLIAPDGVIRRKASLLGDRMERSIELLDAKQAVVPNEVQVISGELAMFRIYDYPYFLFMNLAVQRLFKNPEATITSEGWEEHAGRNCLKLRATSFSYEGETKKTLERLFWLDLERNAQVIGCEYYEDSKMTSRVDDFALVEITHGKGEKYWLPVRCRVQNYKNIKTIYSYPLYERTTTIVDGSVQVDLDLPDSLFTVMRNSALPLSGELGKVEAVSRAGALRQEFEAKPSPPPFKTDPVSVRKRIDENLAEADRQSKELEASSVARSSWSPAGFWQAGFFLAGFGVLATAFFWKWRAR